MKTEKFSITGMSCAACVAHVEKSVKNMQAVSAVNVSLMTNTMSVTYDETAIEEEQIVAAVQKAGYGAFVYEKTQDADAAAKQQMSSEERYVKKRVIWSSVLLLVLMYVSMGHMIGLPIPSAFEGVENGFLFASVQLLLTLPILYLNRKYFIVGFSTLIKGHPNMDSLIAIGASAALVYGFYTMANIYMALEAGNLHIAGHFVHDLYFESAAMILTLVTIGKYLETRSKKKTGEALEKLIALTPKTAHVERDGTEIQIATADIRVGDIVVIRAGERVPVDGKVTASNAVLDLSALTGESIPVSKAEGEILPAGAVSVSGFFKMEATRVGEDTTLSQMVRLVEEAASSKAPIARLADKVAGVFVPVVIGIAVVAAIAWIIAGQSAEFAVTIATAILVISCPCAMGLATPVALMVGVGKGAEYGILVKSGEALELAYKIDTVVLDKTGTITEGKPRVTDIIPMRGNADEMLRIFASIERLSEHPLAKAIVGAAKNQGLETLEVKEFEAVPGRGLTAVIDGVRYRIGNSEMMNEKIQEGEALAAAGKTPLYCAVDEEVIGIIAVADTIKDTSVTAVSELHDMGIDVIMLTGDNEVTASAIGKQTGIESIYAGVLPADKERVVGELIEQGRLVAMVGDGINDSPALARAHVGMAIGAGTDIAIDSADIVLMRNELTDCVAAIRLSKAVIRNVKQNLFWAFFYNCISIPVAAGLLYPMWGIKLSPMLGAAAMSLSSLFVVGNALRLKYFNYTDAGAENTLNERQQAISIEQSNSGVKGDKTYNANEIRKEETMMEKKMIIEGMMCAHCSGRVEKALNAIEGVEATVDLDAKTANIKISGTVSEDTLKTAVTEAGYEVIEII